MVRPTLLVLALLSAAPARAQSSPDTTSSAGTRTPQSFFRTIRAARRAGPVEIDGRVDEPAWLAAEAGDQFTQLEPDEGAPPTAPTRFRVLWDDQSLYVGIECDDFHLRRTR